MKQLPEHGSCFLCGSENPPTPGIEIPGYSYKAR